MGRYVHASRQFLLFFARQCACTSWFVQGLRFWNSCNISLSSKNPLDSAVVHSSKSNQKATPSLLLMNKHWCHPSILKHTHLCKLRTFKNIFTAPWLKNLVEHSYLLPKYSVKISREKKWAFSFYFTFCKRGILHASLWRMAL